MRGRGVRTAMSAANESARAVRLALDRTMAEPNSPGAIVMRRAVRWFAQMLRHAPARSLRDAASAPSDPAVVLRALEAPESIAVLERDDALAEARLRGCEEREKLLKAEGGVLSAAQAARHLHISRQAVDKRRRAGQLIGLPLGRRGYAYPAWQFDRHGTIPGLEPVLAALEGHDPWMRAIFMLAGNARMDDRTPLEMLRRGEVGKVRDVASCFGEQGGA